MREARELNGNGTIITERKLQGPSPSNPANGNYNKYSLEFDTRDLRRILVYVGLWVWASMHGSRSTTSRSAPPLRSSTELRAVSSGAILPSRTPADG